MPLVDVRGRVLNPDPPAGFYLVGECPTCHSPVFYHGGGRFVTTDKLGQSVSVSVPETFFQTCGCPFKDEPFAIPVEYHIGHERDSLTSLFQLIETLLIKYAEAVAALKEVYDEHISNLSEASIEDQSGEADRTEHGDSTGQHTT